MIFARVKFTFFYSIFAENYITYYDLRIYNCHEFEHINTVFTKQQTYLYRETPPTYNFFRLTSGSSTNHSLNHEFLHTHTFPAQQQL